MKRTLLIIAIALIPAVGAWAKKSCTTEPKEKWMSELDFKKMIEQKGYKITKFKKPGTCYEIYGVNQNGKDVEIYFDPTNGKVVKEKIED